MGDFLLEDGRKQLMAKVKNKEKEWNLLILTVLKVSLLMGKDQVKELFNTIMGVYMKENGKMEKWMGRGYFLIRLIQLIFKDNGIRANKEEEEL